MASALALQRVEAKAGQAHVGWCLGRIQRREQDAQPCGVPGIDAARVAGVREPRQPLVAETLDRLEV